MIPDQVTTALRTYVRHVPNGIGAARLASMVDRELRRQPRIAVTRTRGGDLVEVNTADLIQRFLYLFGVWEPNLTAWIQSRLRPGDTFIDVGAHTGYYTLLASHLVGTSGRVVAIEASPEFHRALDDAVRRNGCRNVRTVNVAAADAPGVVKLYLADPGNLGNTSVVRPREFASSFEVAALPLPEILLSGELEHARLIKIDVEGGEASLMAGLDSALDRLPPHAELVIEVTPRSLAKQGHSPDDVLRPLRMHGFHPYRLVNDYDPAGYPSALSRPAVPQRWEQPLVEMSDLIFSRTDAPELAPAT